MARVNNIIGKGLSGRLGNIVFVNSGGITYVRSLPRERKPSEWSTHQKDHRRCFAGVVKFASRMMKPFIIPIWNKAVPGSVRGFNLFVKANKSAFGTNGSITDPGLLRFSAGSLPFSNNLKAIVLSDQPNIITVSWTNQLVNSARSNDHLMVVFYNIYESFVPADTGFKRKEEQAQIPLPEKSGKEIYLYLFFKSEDETLYSDDQVFKIVLEAVVNPPGGLVINQNG